MKNLNLSYLALGAGAVLALTTMAACGSEDEPEGNGFNTAGGAGPGAGGADPSAGGADPSAGGSSAGGSGPGAGGAQAGELECTGECCPSDDSCYGAAPIGAQTEAKNPNKVGDECLAMRDNSKGGPNGERLQYRQSWARTIAPPGNTIMLVYQVLSGGATLPFGATCNMSDDMAATGFMQLLDIDLTDADPLNHTTKSGYAPWFTKAQYDANGATDGICMVEGSFDTPMYALGADQMSTTENWPAGLPDPMPQPWDVRPTIAKRVTADFDVETDRESLLQTIADRQADGVFYRDDATGFSHGYQKQSWVYVASGGNDTGIAIPIREAETIYYANDADERSCMGAYRGGLIPTDTCNSTDQENPNWGYLPSADVPGEAPAVTYGYFLSTELEQVFSSVLGRTLCTHYPGAAASEADGFPGTLCRESAKWDPQAADDAGLPSGDWCSETNGPATPTCHDAFQSISYHTFSAHDVSDATCPLTGY